MVEVGRALEKLFSFNVASFQNKQILQRPETDENKTGEISLCDLILYKNDQTCFVQSRDFF